MAIGFARVSIHTRTKGHSAVAGAAYRSGKSLLDLRTGLQHDYRDRHDVKHSEIILPPGTDEKFLNREFLWNTVESFEKRKDSQLAKDIVLALPRELSHEQQILLAHNFAQTQFVSYGLIADVSIHDHGDGNPHAHIYIPTRRVIGATLAPTKARDLNPEFATGKGGKSFVAEDEIWGNRWRDFQNQFFKEHNLTLEVDENHLVSQRHNGRIRGSEPHYLLEENALRKDISIEIALTDPLALINQLASRYPTFSEQKLQRFITKNSASPEQESKILAAVMSHPALIYLGYSEDGHKTYTSEMNFLKEAAIADYCKELFYKKSVPSSLGKLNKVIADYQLNSEQADALYHITSGRHLAAIVGRAGTGKSYMMRAANDYFTAASFKMHGMAVSGIAAKGLETASGIRSHTIAYYRRRIENNTWNLSKSDIVIMDEAGMTNLHDMHAVIQHVHQHDAKLILIGDHDQLQPINSSATFKAIIERIGFAELNQIQRQEKAGDRQATAWLAQGNIAKAIDYYQETNSITFAKSQQESDSLLIKDWANFLNHSLLQDQIILAHTNAHVNELNLQARSILLANKHLSDTNAFTYKTAKDEILLCAGDRLLLLKNDKNLDVQNGQLATVKTITRNKIIIELDHTKRIVTIDNRDYQDFTYGYAATIHKTQGATFKNVFVSIASAGWDRYLAYVALSRHKEKVKIYASQSNYKSLNALKTQLSRSPVHDGALDYPLMYGIRRGFDSDSLIKRFTQKLTSFSETIKDKWRFITDYEAFQKLAKHQRHMRDKHQSTALATKAALFANWHRSLGREWSEFLSNNNTSQSKTEAYRQELIHRTFEKNKLGSELFTEYPNYQKALSLNKIKKSTLEKAHRNYQRDLQKDSILEPDIQKRLLVAIESHEKCKTRFAKERSIKTIGNLIKDMEKSNQVTYFLAKNPGIATNYNKFKRLSMEHDLQHEK